MAFFKYSSIGKWSEQYRKVGCPAKNGKTKNSRFYDLRIERYKKLQNKN